jgi:hypothetical protein
VGRREGYGEASKQTGIISAKVSSAPQEQLDLSTGEAAAHLPMLQGRIILSL